MFDHRAGAGDQRIGSFGVKCAIATEGLDLMHERFDLVAGGLEFTTFDGSARGIEFLQQRVLATVLQVHRFSLGNQIADRKAVTRDCFRGGLPACEQTQTQDNNPGI